MQRLRVNPRLRVQEIVVQLLGGVADETAARSLQPNVVVTAVSGVLGDGVVVPHLLETERGALRIEVRVARQEGLIAAVTQAAHQRMGVAPGHTVAVAEPSM